jgi:hypothetical protein
MAILPIVVPVPGGLVRNGESEDFLSAQHRIHLLAGGEGFDTSPSLIHSVTDQSSLSAK